MKIFFSLATVMLIASWIVGFFSFALASLVQALLIITALVLLLPGILNIKRQRFP